MISWPPNPHVAEDRTILPALTNPRKRVGSPISHLQSFLPLSLLSICLPFFHKYLLSIYISSLISFQAETNFPVTISCTQTQTCQLLDAKHFPYTSSTPHDDPMCWPLYFTTSPSIWVLRLRHTRAFSHHRPLEASYSETVVEWRRCWSGPGRPGGSGKTPYSASFFTICISVLLFVNQA